MPVTYTHTHTHPARRQHTHTCIHKHTYKPNIHISKQSNPQIIPTKHEADRYTTPEMKVYGAA